MIPLAECNLVLLCAGRSRRFGAADKLMAPLGDRPLVAHAADLARRTACRRRFAVVPPGSSALSGLLAERGFALIDNPEPDAGKDHSLRLGLSAALDPGPEGVLVMLGDMPHVTLAHLQALAEAATPALAAISHDGTTALPPTLFPAALAARVLASADEPIRTALGHPVAVSASKDELADYDTPERFAMIGPAR